MAENLTVTTERVDDIPVLLAQIVKIGVPDLLDERFQPHGNWQGISLGWTSAIWLTHILSRGDHRLSRVQSWTAARLETLQVCTGQPVRELELSDDRLGIVLDELSDAHKWQDFEMALNQRTLRVYRLKPEQVRVDSTTVSGYWTVTEDGLFQFRHSKDHRPDLPQVKVMLSTLDPLGMPMVTQVVSGERADDPLYIPAIQQVSAGLEEHGLLYVGDSKMAALKTRAFVQTQQDFYLCPLPKKQMPEEVLEGYLKPIWTGELTPIPIYRENEHVHREQIAAGYERCVTLSHEGAGKLLTWAERHLIVRSLQQAKASEQALRTRLTQAQTELETLNERRQGKRRPRDRQAMQQACATILKRYRVVGLLKVRIAEQVESDGWQ